MKWSTAALLAALVSTNALADVRVWWTPPPATPNAEITEWLFWCINRYQADGVTERTYGTPVRFPVTQTEYIRSQGYSDGEWKCKVQSYSAEGASGAGAASGDAPDGSNEIFFETLNNNLVVPVDAYPLPPTLINVE